jgi:hypothetical protein
MTACTATFGARASVKSYGGNRYLLTITDDYTRWVKVYSMKLKSEARECFINFEKGSQASTWKRHPMGPSRQWRGSMGALSYTPT